MDFNRNSDQQMLADSVQKYLTATLGTNRKATTPDTDIWAEFVELGWTGLAVPEAAGGLGGTMGDISVLAFEIGKGLLPFPFLNTAVFASQLLVRSANPLAQELLAGIVSGESIPAVALLESQSLYRFDSTQTIARRLGENYQLSGKKILVAGGKLANAILCSARMVSESGEDEGLGIFTVDPASSGITRDGYSLFDGTSAADIGFDAVAVPASRLLLQPDMSAATLTAVIDEISVLLCAEALGCAERATALTVEHLKIREQFGAALAGFQALQHSVANMYIQSSQAQSCLYQAIAALGEPDSADRRRVVSGCFYKIMETAKTVTGMAIHLHGGIGFTTEHLVGHLYRRVLVNEKRWGNSTYHLNRYRALQFPNTL